MIFVPLSTVALAPVGKAGTGNASGMFNFLRNVGGSVGISAANTIAHNGTCRRTATMWSKTFRAQAGCCGVR